jgi:lipopolysaccharide transport system ATP-binding protein
MSDVVIRAEGLGKAYQIRHEVESSHKLFSEMLTDRARRLFRRNRDAGPTQETFWALRDVSFDIREGEVVGVIGRNGAGKSTLLKILSRITEPTEGRVEIRGRVASLLEVGTGFHPELTGRENIFLNGAILGMSRAEIRRKFDEIVDFSGIEKFLDTPVKRFSTGMYVRLAFAVAAHLEPEILIVDEVLAVGDAEFQKKCLGKMGEVADGGRTVLFVSHNLGAVRTLCRKGLYLSEGSVLVAGDVQNVLDAYQKKHTIAMEAMRLPGGMSASINSITQTHFNSNRLEITINLHFDETQIVTDLAVLIYSQSGIRLGIADLRASLSLPHKFTPGSYKILCNIMHLALVEQEYDIGLYVKTLIFSENLFSLYKYLAPPQPKECITYNSHLRGYIDLNVTAIVRSELQSTHVHSNL